MTDRPRTFHQRRLAQLGGSNAVGRGYDRRTRMRDPVLAYAKKYRSSAKWRRLRARKVRRNPLCEECSTAERPVPMAQVDHVLPLHPAHRERERYANLRSLCTSCHAAKSAQERRG